jgi:hypothetical protein
MNINDFVERIKDECPLLNGKVYVVSDFDIDMPTSIQPPFAFVIQMSEDGGEITNNKLNQRGYSQEMTAQIGVVIAVKSVKDLRGAENNNLLQEIRDETNEALRGWIAPGTTTKVAFLAGKPTYYRNLVSYWSDVFQTKFIFKSNQF